MPETEMQTTRCPACLQTLSEVAAFCPKCGGKVVGTPAGKGPAASTELRRRQTREVLIGWVFLVLGLALLVNVAVGHGGLKSWLGGVLGIVLLLLGLGALVGESGTSGKK